MSNGNARIKALFDESYRDQGRVICASRADLRAAMTLTGKRVPIEDALDVLAWISDGADIPDDTDESTLLIARLAYGIAVTRTKLALADEYDFAEPIDVSRIPVSDRERALSVMGVTDIALADIDATIASVNDAADRIRTMYEDADSILYTDEDAGNVELERLSGLIEDALNTDAGQAVRYIIGSSVSPRV